MLHLLSLLPVLAAPTAIVGGTPVAPGTWRDATAVISPTAACTGTLIAPDLVLTAGHCLDPAPIFVVVDSVDYARPGGEPIRVKAAIAYPDWQNSYDVGVLVLDRPATAPPRAIASGCTLRDALVTGAPVRLVGFGLTTPSGTGANTALHEGVAPVLDAACRDPDACMPSIAPGGEFIAGGGAVDSCFGDSGGPVYLDTPDGPALAGVVSRAFALAGLPCGAGGVYVRADKILAWLQRTTHRPIAHTRCAGASDEVAITASEPEPAGGCDARGGAGGSLLIGLGGFTAAAVYRRRRAR